MRSKLIVALAALAVLVAGSCTSLPVATQDASCAGAAIAAIWSSETSATRIDLYDAEGKHLDKLDVSVKGLPPNAGFVPRGGKFIGVANGDAKHTETNIVEFDPGTCRVQLRRIPEPVVNAVAVGSDAVYTTNTLNAEAHFTRHADDGSSESVRFAGETGTNVAVWRDNLLAVSVAGEGGKSRLRALDAKTLKPRWELDLPVQVDLGPNSLVVGSKLYLPVPIDAVAERPQDLLLVVDLDHRTVRTMTLGAPSPYRIRTAGSGLVVAHTFMNPGFQPMHTYRTVSIVDAGGKATQHEVGVGVAQIEVTEQVFYISGELEDETYRMEVRRRSDFGLVTQFDLPQPTGMGHVYSAGFVALG